MYAVYTGVCMLCRGCVCCVEGCVEGSVYAV